jgi:hypothetical protein
MARKQQSVQEMDEKLAQKQKAAEERRLALLNEQKEKAAAAVSHAKDVAAQQQQKEIQQREELKNEINTKLAEAHNRRMSGGLSVRCRASPIAVRGLRLNPESDHPPLFPFSAAFTAQVPCRRAKLHRETKHRGWHLLAYPCPAPTGVKQPSLANEDLCLPNLVLLVRTHCVGVVCCNADYHDVSPTTCVRFASRCLYVVLC